MRFSGIVVLLAVTLSSFCAWIEFNRPTVPNEAHYPFAGLSYNPYLRDQGPFEKVLPAPEVIDGDLSMLSSRTKSIRVYRASQGFEVIPEIARTHKLSVILTAWLDSDRIQNEKEVEAAITLAGRNKNVSRLVLGNETQLLGTVSEAELISYLDAARKRLRTPVSTAEPWDYWINHPEMVKHVDFIAIHVLPYWKEIPIENAVDYVFEKFDAVKRAYPYKMVVIGETGWPSDGPQRGAAEASVTNQARFIRDFVRRAELAKINYNVIEAFDQPWKSALEGRAGEHWGIMDADRHEKFPIAGPVLEDPHWEFWAVSCFIIAFVTGGVYLLRRPSLRIGGQLFGIAMIQTAAWGGTRLAHEAAGQYMSPMDIVFWTVMIGLQAIVAVILLTDTAEIADVVGERPLRRKFPPYVGPVPEGGLPFVSLHLACCKEPPELVITTLDSLAKLDYPNFEVIVVDNNTFDEKLWRPVEARCRELGERFRFFSLGKWPGFKAGALNFALRQTAPEAEVVGVVDADYVVEPNWLKAAAPYFALDSEIAVVQAPQEHRSWEGNLFQRMENDEYSGFFRIGMVQRNEDNAIIQHGTMTLIRRNELLGAGGWAEWCICEDAELGLRLLCRGKEAVYIDHVFGRGLVPDSYEAYSKQRFRWAYGGMRIMRRYWRELVGIRPGLSARQRYQFLKGWLPWIGDAMHLGFTAAGLVWSAVLLYDPLQTDFPEPLFLYPALALVVLRVVGTALTYAARVRIGHERTLLAMIAGGSLTHTVAKAVVQGLLTSSKPFYRTPKLDKASPILRSILFVYQEVFLTVMLIATAVLVVREFGLLNDSAVLWAVTLAAQATPYLAALIASLVSSLSVRGAGRSASVSPSASAAGGIQSAGVVP